MAYTSIYTRKLANLIAQSATPSIPGVFHIISTISNKWAVVLQGTTKAIRIFSAKRDAISFARKKAASCLVNEIVVHDEHSVTSYSIYLNHLTPARTTNVRKKPVH